MPTADVTRAMYREGLKDTADLMDRMGDLLMRVSDGLRDDGDSVSLETTNQADEIRAMTQEWFKFKYLNNYNP